MRKARAPVVQVFAAPALIALVSGAGLVAALVGAGLVDVLSWFAVGAPVLAAAWAFARRER